MVALVVGKRLLVPNRAFIEEQFGALRIPVAGNIQYSRGIEVVFDKVTRSLGPGIFVEAHARAYFVRIHDGTPGPVEADAGPARDICDEGDGAAVAVRKPANKQIAISRNLLGARMGILCVNHRPAVE